MRIQITLITRSVNTLLCSRLINRSITQRTVPVPSPVPVSVSLRVPVPTHTERAIMIYRILINLKCLKRYKSEEIMNVLLS